jgi:2-alkenal reductase
MENKKRFALIAGLGCAAAVVITIAVIGLLLLGPIGLFGVVRRQGEVREEQATMPAAEVTREVVEVRPTLTPVPDETREVEAPPRQGEPQIESGSLAALYDETNPGVVSIRVYVERGGMTGEGAGSGFILDDEGYIVTNNHVVAQAEGVTAIFYDGFEATAEIVGTDEDSDLAVIKVDELPEGTRPLALGDSDTVQPGDWVVAIGNPFRLGGSMSLGIVSAVGRAIPSGVTPFRIPQAIQTDAAINPGNSGGPLLNLDGQVVGVNAQIASGSGGVNSGVGFAIPANVVRRVAPTLIEEGVYQWPWLGVSGTSVNLLLQEANDLPVQQGAYIGEVNEGGPAAEAGIQGATGTTRLNGLEVPVGGDVVVEADGETISEFNDLLAYVAFKRPGDAVALTVLRDGERQQVTVELGVRPSQFRP